MMKFILALALVVVAVNGLKVNTCSRKPSSFALKSSEGDFKPSSQSGKSGPFGFFDPLGLSNGISEGQFKQFREAEVKHSRVAMLAFLGLLAGEVFPHPFFNGEITGPAIYQFQQTYTSSFPFFWLVLTGAIGLIEAKSIASKWRIGGLNPNAVAGDEGFDPLGFKPSSPDALATIQTKELNNGRLAMIGTAGFIVQELVTGRGIFN